MLFFLVSLVLAYFLLKEAWMRWHCDIHKIPTPPKLPVLGHALSIRKGNKTLAINVWLQEWREKLGFPKVMRICLFGRTIVVATDINLIRNVVLGKTCGNLKQGHIIRQVQHLVMGDDPTPCMFTTSTATPYVKAIRRSYAASFTSVGMKSLFEKQLEIMHQGKLYLDARQHQDTIDFQDFCNRLLLDVAGRAELDLDLGALDNSSPLCDLLIECGHHMRSLATIPFFELRTKLFPNSGFAQRINQDFKALHEQWTKIALEVHNRGEPDEEDITFAANLKRVCMPGTKDPLPFNLLKGELATAIVGGFDTTSHQLAWTFALLAAHPFVVEKLFDELKSHGLYGVNARELEYEDLSELKYLTAVVKEAMRRIHTMVFVAARIASRDLVLGEYRIPKGTALWIPSNLSMNCEIEWEDHLAFKPERWLQQNTNTNIKDKYYIPFGLGERECPGMKLAMQSMRTAIVYFITRYSFELVGDTLDSLMQNTIAGLVFEAKDGINIKVNPRTGP